MKTSQYLRTLSVWAVGLGLISVCGTGCIGTGTDGVGEYERQTRSVADFSKIDLALSGKVQVRQGAAFSVVVEAQGNLMELIETKVDGSTLVITSKGNIGNAKELHYFITMPQLTGVEVSGSGTVDVLDVFSPDELEVDISGSGRVQANVIAESISADISGSGYLKLDGSADELDADISGAGEVEALGLAAKEVSVEISGSGTAEVQAQESLSMDISGSGVVKYKGHPSRLKQDISGSGKGIQL